MRVTVAFSPSARQVDLVEVELAPGALLIDAIRASGLLDRFPQLGDPGQRFGVWGASRTPHHVLHEGDRIEAYRPLHIDPKDARRLRHRQNSAVKR